VFHTPALPSSFCVSTSCFDTYVAYSTMFLLLLPVFITTTLPPPPHHHKVAEQVGNTTLVAKALDQLEDALDPWLQGANSDALVYDSTWGGLISASGVENQDADFGNGW
jgi:hypothetical protein